MHFWDKVSSKQIENSSGTVCTLCTKMNYFVIVNTHKQKYYKLWVGDNIETHAMYTPKKPDFSEPLISKAC